MLHWKTVLRGKFWQSTETFPLADHPFSGPRLLRVRTKVCMVSNVSTKISWSILDCSLKTFFYVLGCYTIKNCHFFEMIKKLLEGCKLGSVLGYFRQIRPKIKFRIRLTWSKTQSLSSACNLTAASFVSDTVLP